MSNSTTPTPDQMYLPNVKNTLNPIYMQNTDLDLQTLRFFPPELPPHVDRGIMDASQSVPCVSTLVERKHFQHI